MHGGPLINTSPSIAPSPLPLPPVQVAHPPAMKVTHLLAMKMAQLPAVKVTHLLLMKMAQLPAMKVTHLPAMKTAHHLFRRNSGSCGAKPNT